MEEYRFTVGPDVKQRLCEAAESTGKSVESLIEEALWDYANSEKITKNCTRA